MINLLSVRHLLARAAVACAAVALFLPTPAHATPLRMDYTLTALAGSLYQYDFSLTLDNHDGTWVPGDQWDWIIFGDNDSAATWVGFDADGGGPMTSDWHTLSFSPPISGVSSSWTGHNGPTLYIDGNGPMVPGWSPTSVGESLTWSGTSHVYIPDGQLYWSALEPGIVGEALPVDFELAHQSGAASVPEPASLFLFGTGLLALTWPRRRR